MNLTQQTQPKAQTTRDRRSMAGQLAPRDGITTSHDATSKQQLTERRLTPQNVMYLQRTIGNAAVQRLLEDQQTDNSASRGDVRQHTPPIIQPQLKVGPANDRFEREADDISRQIVQRTPTRRVQRDSASTAEVGMEGGTVDNNLERSIHRSKNGGSSIPDGVRSQIEPKLGADLSTVKVHTDSQSADLNRKLGAKAFTHKNHIFYGAGQSPSDVKLTAHEAVHTVQQGATTQRKSTKDTLQRVYQHPENAKFYSHVLPKQEITEDNGVVTAAATSKWFGGGHTILMFEYVEGGTPINKKIDLTAGGGTRSSGSVIKDDSGSASAQISSGSMTLTDNSTFGSTGSGSSGTGTIQINISMASDTSLKKLLSSPKRSFVVTKDQIKAGIAEAEAVQQDMIKNPVKYTYKLFARSIFAKNPLNCARFGEQVLIKAGISASATSLRWFGGKTPFKLATGMDVGYKPDQNFPEPRQQHTAPTPTPVVGTAGQANPDEFNHIPETETVTRNVTFTEDKVLPGDVKEFDYKSDPDLIFTFKTDPQDEYDLPLKIFKVIVFREKGLAQLIPPVGECQVSSAWVKLSDLYSSNGRIIIA